MNLLTEKTALITGAGQGIGRAIALLLASRGARVAALDVRAGVLEEVETALGEIGPNHLALQADVTVRADVESAVARTIETFGRLDIVVNNAGASWGTLELDVDDDLWTKIVDLNLTGQFYLVRAVVPQMKKQAYGRLIGITSDAARFRSYGAGFPYVAAKGGVHGMHRKLAEELGPWSITANVVSPGNVMTEEGRKYMEQPSMQGLLADCPLGRWTEPDEIASVVLFLASDLASHVTGVTISVNGGWHMVW